MSNLPFIIIIKMGVIGTQDSTWKSLWHLYTFKGDNLEAFFKLHTDYPEYDCVKDYYRIKPQSNYFIKDSQEVMMTETISLLHPSNHTMSSITQ